MKRFKWLTLPFMLLLLSGCLYPQSQLSKNQIPNQVQLDQIQQAVTSYQQQTNGLLPIKTKPEDTPIFQKYQIDFSKLREKGLIGETPGTAFENGGHYLYVIIKPESKPTVKLLDLRTSERLRALQVKIKFYKEKHQYPPFGKQVANGIYNLKYKELGLEQPPVVDSPYSEQMLPIYINAKGELLIDYRKDLYAYLNEQDHTYKNGEDIRYLLTDHAPFVPGYSPPYTVKDGEPVFMTNTAS
ncbi:hypothetical protein MUN89_12055 [Halobacillus salinarum]|uniref:Lipoprotein n=1 Tax=Halobacillus salinarum TaxID=2932257 RepID=A0ABY4EGF8_9BACI|nr:hypothetical protein [Halobacillus salinarum]UOQ42704.1 hypothetical protein MUN89_12055 [Halobacillus salinarum]